MGNVQLKKKPDIGLKVQNTLEKENGLWMVKKKSIAFMANTAPLSSQGVICSEGPSD